MRRPLAALFMPFVVLAGPIAGAGASRPPAPVAVAKAAPASVTLTDCHPSDDVTQRHASFNGQMRAVTGAKRMAMRFTLLERIGTGLAPFKPVSLPDLKPWRRSKAGARAFIYTQRVTALRDGGSYRMRVQFRWYDGHKNVQRTSILRSRGCHQ